MRAESTTPSCSFLLNFRHMPFSMSLCHSYLRSTALQTMLSHILALACFVAMQVSADTPTAHLQPFGSHRPPSVVIDEFTKDNAPRPKDFYENYVKHSKAAIFRGGVENSKAYKLWTDDYIRENFGDMEVRLEGKHEKKHLPPIGEKYLGRDTLRHFVDGYHNPGNNVYIVSDLPSSMYADMEVIPSMGSCGEMAKRIVEVNIWWSGGGSSSIIHKDAYHQINCLLNGTKYWKLIEYKYEKDIYRHPEPERELGGFSDVDPKKVDLKKFPKIQAVEWSNFTINAGDCLYLPKSYYHQVESSGTHNLAVSLLFGRFDGRDSLDFSDCKDNTDYETPHSLAEFDVLLVWVGKGNMVMGRTDLEDGYRNSLLELIRESEQKGQSVDFETFQSFLDDEQDGSILRIGDVKKGFDILDKNGDGIVSTKEVETLTLEELQKIGNEIEPWEPSNAYEFEYSIISYETVWWLLKTCLKSFKILKKPTWLKHYKRLGGSEDFGAEVFDRLGGGKTEIISKDIGKNEIWIALENWRKFWAPQYSALTEQPTKENEESLWAWARGEGNLEEEGAVGERGEYNNIDMTEDEDFDDTENMDMTENGDFDKTRFRNEEL